MVRRVLEAEEFRTVAKPTDLLRPCSLKRLHGRADLIGSNRCAQSPETYKVQLNRSCYFGIPSTHQSLKIWGLNI